MGFIQVCRTSVKIQGNVLPSNGNGRHELDIILHRGCADSSRLVWFSGCLVTRCMGEYPVQRLEISQVQVVEVGGRDAIFAVCFAQSMWAVGDVAAALDAWDPDGFCLWVSCWFVWGWSSEDIEVQKEEYKRNGKMHLVCLQLGVELSMNGLVPPGDQTRQI